MSRAGYYNDKIYLCLYSKAHEVVEISAQGWKVISESEAPVLFVPNATALELPVPQRGGSLQQLSNLVNMDKQDFRLLVLWLLAVLNPSIECPILSISAGYGAGKTTLTRFIKSLIDPDNAGELAPFSKEDDLYAASSSRYIISVDNVSKISKKWSDIYCRLTTGAGAVKRKNYTNNEAFDLRVRNPLILNGIDFDPVFPDLRDRCLFLRLKQLKERKSKHELEEKFDAIHPQILGALLDAVVAALRNTKYRLERDIGFRMLDTAEFAMKAADAGALPFTKAELRESLEARNSEVKAEELMNDSVGRAVYEIVNEKLSESVEAESIVEMRSEELWKKVTEKAKSYSSTIAKAYSAGYFPDFTHQRLFHAIATALDGRNEGSVDFAKVLEDAGMHRSSALKIIRHMSNFGILEVSFNSSHVIGEARKSWAHIKILRNPEHSDLPKSA